MYLYNSLSRKKEKFVPNDPSIVKMYTCGPTVYHYAHIGNLRTYIMEDVLEKALRYCGYNVKRVMNITDVGHLASDADTGEDKMLKGARRENKSVMEIAQFYTDAFFEDCKKLKETERLDGIYSRATELLNTKQFDEAAKLFTIALDNNPYQPELWCMLGSILFRQNNFTEAIRAYDYALAIEPNDSLTRLQRGHCLFNLGQFNEAIEPYEEYLAEHPDDAIVITFLAETYENIDNLQRAKELYLQALAIYDEIPEAWIGLASCQHDIDGLITAYETIKQADEKFPENQHIIYCMSRIEADLAAANFDDFLLNQSLQHLLFCLENDPENETLNFEAANILLQFGDYENAIKLYEVAYSKNPFIEKITLFMSMNYFALGNTEKAKKFLDIARETISNADEIFLSLFPNAQTLIK